MVHDQETQLHQHPSYATRDHLHVVPAVVRLRGVPPVDPPEQVHDLTEHPRVEVALLPLTHRCPTHRRRGPAGSALPSPSDLLTPVRLLTSIHLIFVFCEHVHEYGCRRPPAPIEQLIGLMVRPGRAVAPLVNGPIVDPAPQEPVGEILNTSMCPQYPQLKWARRYRLDTRLRVPTSTCRRPAARAG